MFDRIQNIGAINGSNNLIINGDVVANGEILTAIANQLLRQDFERVSQEAREEMQACANECVFYLTLFFTIPSPNLIKTPRKR